MAKGKNNKLATVLYRHQMAIYSQMRTCVVVAASFRQMSIIEKQQKRFSFSLTQRQVVINGVRPRPQFHLHLFFW